MKIKVEVELAEGEAGLAPGVTKVLQSLTDNVKTTITTDKAAVQKAIMDGVKSQQLEAVTADLSRRFSKAELYQDAVDALCECMFERTAGDSTSSSEAAQFVQILVRQQGPTRAKVQEEVITRIMNFFSAKRRPDCSRRALMPYCEMFAALLKADAIPFKGSVQAITSLINFEATRVAGITALGKLIEQAADAIVDRCDPNTLERLRAALNNAGGGADGSDYFAYDIEYITEPLGWSTKSSSSGSGTNGTSGNNSQLAFQRPCKHHSKSILSLAYSPGRDILVSASSDGSIGTWDCSAQGNLVETCTLARHFACSVDVSSRGNIMLVAGAGQNYGTMPAVVYYAEDSNHWVERGAVQPDNVRIISCAKILKAQQGFFFACGLYGPSGSRVAYYDGARNQPVREFSDHTDIVTSIYTPVDRENTIVTGSRDCTLIIYDVRGATATLSTPLFGTVSAIAGVGDYLVCGGLDKRLSVYDSRMMTQAIASKDMDSPILDVGVSQHQTCTVATMTGLHLVNLHNMQQPSTRADHGGASSTRYNSVQWHSSGTILMAGADNGSLDFYSMNNPTTAF